MLAQVVPVVRRKEDEGVVRLAERLDAVEHDADEVVEVLERRRAVAEADVHAVRLKGRDDVELAHRVGHGAAADGLVEGGRVRVREAVEGVLVPERRAGRHGEAARPEGARLLAAAPRREVRFPMGIVHGVRRLALRPVTNTEVCH